MGVVGRSARRWVCPAMQRIAKKETAQHKLMRSSVLTAARRLGALAALARARRRQVAAPGAAVALAACHPRLVLQLRDGVDIGIVRAIPMLSMLRMQVRVAACHTLGHADATEVRAAALTALECEASITVSDMIDGTLVAPETCSADAPPCRHPWNHRGPPADHMMALPPPLRRHLSCSATGGARAAVRPALQRKDLIITSQRILHHQNSHHASCNTYVGRCTVSRPRK